MMKNIAVINPTNKEIDYSFKEIQMEEIPFEQEEIINSNHPERLIYNFLEKGIAKLQQFNGILISCNCDWKISTNIILYLRLNEKWNIGSHPIIWDSKKELSEVLLLSINENFHNSFIPNDLTHFIDRRLHKSINSEIEGHFLSDHNDLFSLEQITVKPYKSSGHQITNEWGAFKLAYTAGFYHLLSIIEEQQEASKTLYFNYLKRKYINDEVANTEGVETDSNPAKKYLLIDDNYDKGWELVFTEILKQANLGLDAFEEIKNINEENEEHLIEEIKTKVKDPDYQGILLDLRLTASDDSPTKSNTGITDFTGGRILKALKEEFPFLPIIMVTASNKAWNMRQLLNEGADGYFIKEDPESNPSEEVSTNTYEAFVELIKDSSQEKYKTLAPFWKYIDDIRKNPTLITERDGSVVQERIRERLEMFFGLLKRSFEDSEYNGRFHYSDKALAFMTLWSCLNDIQYIYYDKSESWTNNNGKTKNAIRVDPNRVKNLTLLSSYLQQRKPTTNGFDVYLKFDYNNTPHYQLLTSPISGDYSRNIGEQIAFLVLKFGENESIQDITSGQITSTILCNNLARIKDKRNHLYLTHGDETNVIFFQQLEEDNQEITLEDCAQLFEIVYFLLKGSYVQINV